jgi:hypothetical protein
MTKRETLDRWLQQQGTVNPLSVMGIIPDKATGSSYGACGIRIDGTPEFIDAVMGKLKDLIDGENHLTRLELSRNEVKPVTINGTTKHFAKADTDAEVCYIRLHERGRAMGTEMSAMFDRQLDGATKRFATSRK